MDRIRIPQSEFESRRDVILKSLKERKVDAIFVYGDEYRKENLRYVSNVWPLFERGAAVFSDVADPIVLCAPEGIELTREMSAWQDIRIVPDFLCVTVPDEIEYPLAVFTSFKKVAEELREKGCALSKLGVVGLDAMSEALVNSLRSSFGAELVDMNDLLFDMRKVKSENEIACLREAARIADAAYKVLMSSDIIGLTEIQAAGIIEGAARKEGAEHIIFNVMGSGERTNTIIGRPAYKVIEDGDMIMCALAVHYEGYVATCEVPFDVGNYSAETKRVLDVLIKASSAGIAHLRPGNPMNNFVKAVREVFRTEGLSEYDVYPPLHGIGCAEAESPYPNEETEAVFEVGMTCNTDISLFGLKGGSNRIEEGFVITENGADTLSPFCRSHCLEWLAKM